MTFREFIRKNREVIDRTINSRKYGGSYWEKGRDIPYPPPTYNDEERRNWILNDEGLYRWAQSEGVRI